jgi:hypothetical protein
MAKSVSVKLASAMAGHLFDDKGQVTGTFAYAAGDVVERPEDEAKRLIERGFASPVNAENKRG